jgi:hypothetical protein
LDGDISNPCFSGTGMSFEAFMSETTSAVAKPATRRFVFSDLANLTPNEVSVYLQTFLNFDNVESDLVEHVAKWLSGRPRWTASFLEEFFICGPAMMPTEVRGRYKDEEQPLIMALQRYIDILTQPGTIVKRRHSWQATKKSAYACIERVFQQTGKDWSEAQREIRKATSNFALGGNSSVITIQSAKLIKMGVTSVHTDGVVLTDSSHVRASFNEPLMVQASINFFELDKTVAERLH